MFRLVKGRFDSIDVNIDWLQHRWPFEIRTFEMTGRKTFNVHVGQCVVSSHPGRAEAEHWINAVTIESVATIVARLRHLRPALVLVEGPGSHRARIPPELWATYDGLVLSGHESAPACILSAKARALFSGDPEVFIRIYSPSRPPASRRR